MLAWLGAALRSSPEEDGVCCCTPRLTKVHELDGFDLTPTPSIQRAHHKSPSLDLSTPVHARPATPLMVDCHYKVCFSFGRQGVAGSDAGRCWYGLFKNPVIVAGYPIAKRTAVHTGVEMTLDVMSILVGSDRLVPFDSTWYLKGFSSMLVLAERREDVLLWHHIRNRDGGHVSYFDHKGKAPMNLRLSEVLDSRHVVGWCSEVNLFAGKSQV